MNYPVKTNKVQTLLVITARKNIHLNCDNFNPKKDFCLKFFRGNISELKECQEKTVFNDTELSRKWSN